MERFIICHRYNFRRGLKTIRNAYRQSHNSLQNSRCTYHIIIILLLCRGWYGEQRAIRIRGVNHFCVCTYIYIYINNNVRMYNDYILSCPAQVTDTHRRRPSAGRNI